MCIIAIKPQGKEMFDDNTIKTMFINNPDGAGFAYNKGANIIISKGYMNTKSLLNALHKIDLKDSNVILHFRIGTSGKNDELNCHPFPIKDKNRTHMTTKRVMAHNGVLSAFNPPKGSAINDTQIFIRDVVNELDDDFLNDKDTVLLLKKLIGSNKLAFLDKNGITTIGDFVMEDGYLFSNKSYKQTNYYAYRGTTYYNAYHPTASTPKKEEKKPQKSVSKKSVTETRHTLSSDDLKFWHDEPSEFWDNFDKRHSS